MKPASQKAKPKVPAPARRDRGRPSVDERKTTTSIRFDPAFMAELDAWAKDHGDIGRSAAIRLAVSNMLRGRAAEKSS